MNKIKIGLEKHPEKEWYRIVLQCSCYPLSYTIFPVESNDVETIQRIFNCDIKTSFED